MVTRLIRNAIGNGFVLLVLFFIAFALFAKPILWVLRVVLEAINSI
jgi:hypothetical protein